MAKNKSEGLTLRLKNILTKCSYSVPNERLDEYLQQDNATCHSARIVQKGSRHIKVQ